MRRRRASVVLLSASVAALLLAGCVRVRWQHASDWDTFTEEPVSNVTNTIERSVDPGAGVGRLTAFGTEGNDRRFYLAEHQPATDSEVTALWHGHSLQQAGGGQLGEVLRAQLLPDGRVTAYVVWHDYIYGQDEIVHAAVWTSAAGAGPDLQVTYLGSASFDALEKVVDVAGASRAGGTVTMSVGEGHGLRVGDRLVVSLADGSYDGVHDVTAVGATWAQYDATGADGTSGGGTVQDLDQVMPYWVHAKLVGTTISYKVWPEGQPEPAWDDPVWARRFVDTTGAGPTGEGYDGLYAGHTRAGGYVEYGPVDIFSHDPTSTTTTNATGTTRTTTATAGPSGLQPPTGTAPSRSDPRAVRARGKGAGMPVVQAGSGP